MLLHDEDGDHDDVHKPLFDREAVADMGDSDLRAHVDTDPNHYGSEVHHVSTRLIFSEYAPYVYLAALLVQAATLGAAYYYGQRNIGPLFWVELFIVALLALEIILRYWSSPQNYFEAWDNKLDIFVFVLCTVGMVLFYIDLDKLTHAQRERYETGIVCGRYALQIVRILLLVKRLYDLNDMHMAADTKVKFSQPQPAAFGGTVNRTRHADTNYRE